MKVRKLAFGLLTTFLLTVFVGFFRLYTVAGPSDAPSLIWNDKVLANVSAYDYSIPFTHTKLFRTGNPQRGDFVVFRHPDDKIVTGLKRIVAVPGDKIEIVNHHIKLNGELLSYTQREIGEFEWVPAENDIGAEVWEESLNGQRYTITYTPGKAEASYSNFGPITLGQDEYFILGDNRDNSNDSRVFGPLPRSEINGKIIALLQQHVKR